MTFSYSGDPATSDKDAVRYEVGDTNEKTQLVQDEEINYALTKEGTVLKAAARVAQGLAARFAREEHVRIATFGTMRSMLQTHFQELAENLRRRGIRRGSFIVPSLTCSGKRSNTSDPDLVMTRSRHGIHRNPDANGSQDGKTDCGCANLACGHRI